MAGSVPIKAQSFLGELNFFISPISARKDIAVVLPMPLIEESIERSSLKFCWLSSSICISRREISSCKARRSRILDCKIASNEEDETPTDLLANSLMLLAEIGDLPCEAESKIL